MTLRDCVDVPSGEAHLLWLQSPGGGCPPLTAFQTQKGKTTTVQLCLHPSRHSPAARERPRCPTRGSRLPTALGSCSSSALPSTVEAARLCSSQWSLAPATEPPAPASLTLEGCHLPSLPNRSLSQPLPAMPAHGTHHKGTFPHPGRQAQTTAGPGGLPPYTGSNVCQATLHRVAGTVHSTLQMVPTCPGGEGLTRAQCSPIPSPQLFPGDTWKQQGKRRWQVPHVATLLETL